MRIAIVGICASGKTTLVRGLRVAGYDADNVAQELVMIDATLDTVKKRRVVYWGQNRIDTQHKRLADAKAHADLYIQTDALDAEAVKQKVIDFLKNKNGKE